MIPSQPDREDDQTRSEPDGFRADGDGDSDQSRSNRDQSAADLDQLAADQDQAASDRDLAHGVDREAYDSSREARVRTTLARRATSIERRKTANATGASEHMSDWADALTGARRRGPGLVEMQRDIDRVRLGDGRLIAAYVDIDGVQDINDSDGHVVDDGLLRQVVGVLRSHLRSHESVVRLGGEEFVCTFPHTTIETVRQRLGQIMAELNLTPDDGTVAVGLAELARGDSAMDLIARADRALVTSRETRIRNRQTGD